MITATLRIVAPLALALFLLPKQEGPLPLDAAVAGDGAIFLLESPGERLLTIKVRRGTKESVTPLDLSPLPEGDKVLEARIVPWDVAGGSDGAVIVLVLEHEGAHSYRFLVSHMPSRSQAFVLSDPIFESRGEPFRIIDARATASTADGLEITFRRGRYSVRKNTGSVEERIYVDTCSPVGLGGSKLYDVRTGQEIQGPVAREDSK